MPIMAKCLLGLSGLFGALAIALGAVGSHALKSRLTSDAFDIYHTAVNYLLIHAVMLAVVGALLACRGGRNYLLGAAGVSFVLGMVLFCGGLLTKVVFGFSWFSGAAPVGGLALIAGWLLVSVSALVNK